MKTYQISQLIDTSNLGEPIQAFKTVAGSWSPQEVETDFTLIPSEPGRVVIVAQNKRTGDGHLTLRWGRKGEVGSICASYQLGTGAGLVLA